MIELGKTYKDTIHGFEGVATSRTEFLHGCDRVRLERMDDKGEIKVEVFDVLQLEGIDLPEVALGGPGDESSKPSMSTRD